MVQSLGYSMTDATFAGDLPQALHLIYERVRSRGARVLSGDLEAAVHLAGLSGDLCNVVRPEYSYLGYE
jgi:hypothetical protein